MFARLFSGKKKPGRAGFKVGCDGSVTRKTVLAIDIGTAPKNAELFAVDKKRCVVINVYVRWQHIFLIALVILELREEYTVSSVTSVNV